jgi:hypothetical protein
MLDWKDGYRNFNAMRKIFLLETRCHWGYLIKEDEEKFIDSIPFNQW